MVSVRLKAGDLAPDIVFTEVLSAGAAAPWLSANLSGQLTVLAFRPVTSLNPHLVASWNALAELFTDQPVQFVWITAEYQPRLGPWLREHPVKGWVFLDPLGATALSYGIERAATVFIGPDRRIAGFDYTMQLTAETLTAALDGRLTSVHLDAEPPRIPGPEDFRPDLPPSETVHISPARSESGTTRVTAPDHWLALGFTLKGLLSEAYRVHAIYVDLAPYLDSGVRYDAALVLPLAESQEKMDTRIQRAIEQHFQLDVSRQIRPVDIYVLTPPDRSDLSRSLGHNVGWQPVAPSSLAEVMVGNPSAITDLQRGGFPFPVQHLPAIGRGFAHVGPVLPFSSGWLVVDETERDGYCAIDVVCIGHGSPEQLFRALEKDTGAVATLERRDLEMLAVRRRRPRRRIARPVC
jgi:hypothetical protein